MKTVLESKRVMTVAGAALFAAAGSCWGYLYAQREAEARIEEEVEKRLDVEIAKTRRFYQTVYKDYQPEDLSDPSYIPPDVVVDEEDEQHVVIDKRALATPEGRAKVASQLAAAILEEDGGEANTDDSDDDTDEVVEQRVFDPEPAPDVDIGALISDRSPEKPYVISRDEYGRNDAHYETFNLTFFDNDGVLMDDKDDIIPDSNEVVGDDNLQRFGVMSEDNNVVYVQNDRSETIYRITRTFQSVHEAVFGVPDEDTHLSHSSMKRRRPRREDE